MSHIEKVLIRAGAVLVKCNRHKVYELNGRRFTISQGNKANNTRSRHKPTLNYLKSLEKK